MVYLTKTRRDYGLENGQHEHGSLLMEVHPRLVCMSTNLG